MRSLMRNSFIRRAAEYNFSTDLPRVRVSQSLKLIGTDIVIRNRMKADVLEKGEKEKNVLEIVDVKQLLDI